MTGTPAARLAGKVGLISGAAGGIGSSAARAFAAAGAVVGLLDRPARQLHDLADELGEHGIALPVDVTDESSVQEAFAGWSRYWDRADFVYVCAGIQLHDSDDRAGDLGLETWQRTIDVNLTGAFLTVKHAIGPLCRSAAGSLILCGSPTGLTLSGAGYTAYSAAKAGMMSLARTVAADYATDGVRANVIVPGTTQTPLIDALLSDPGSRTALQNAIPSGRLGTPADLDGIALFLASDESRYATGATFFVDGGLSHR